MASYTDRDRTENVFDDKVKIVKYSYFFARGLSVVDPLPRAPRERGYVEKDKWMDRTKTRTGTKLVIYYVYVRK